jgi:hypothetical protein
VGEKATGEVLQTKCRVIILFGNYRLHFFVGSFAVLMCCSPLSTITRAGEWRGKVTRASCQQWRSQVLGTRSGYSQWLAFVGRNREN